MKVEAEVKIKILDGEEKGKIDTFKIIDETDTMYTEYGTIEHLRLEWKHIHNCHLWDDPTESKEVKKEVNKVLDKIVDEIQEYKSRKIFGVGVADLEKGKETALDYVLAIIDKYKVGE